jgi:polar amino acid transport system substrate-binding protein
MTHGIVRHLRGWLAMGIVGLGIIAGPARASDPCADFVPQPKPQNVGRDIVGQDIDTIMERGYMTFALYEDFAPYSWEEKGQPRGIDVDVARLIAEYIGVEPRFRFVGSGENLEADLRHNIWRGPLIGGSVSNVMMRIPYDSAFYGNARNTGRRINAPATSSGRRFWTPRSSRPACPAARS